MENQVSSPTTGSLAAIGRQVSVASDEAIAVLDTKLEGLWSLNEICDQYKLWASSWGLLRSGHSSLDYRFRKVPSVSDHTQNILSEMLQEFVKIRDNDEKDFEEGLVEIAFSDSSDSESELEVVRERERSVARSKQQQLDGSISHLSFLLRSLYRVSTAVQHSNARIRPPTSAADPDINVEGERAYVRHLIKRDAISDWWVELPEWLQQRLVNANLGRRHLFAKWRAAYDKRSRTQAVDNSGKAISSFNRNLPRNALIVERAPASEGSFSAVPTLIPYQSMARSLAPSYEPSLKSDTISVFSTQGKSPSINVFPSLPLPFRKIQNGRSFDCPYCWMPCPRKYLKPSAWKEHTRRDLYPYICLQEHCHEAPELFADREEWHAHQLSHFQSESFPEAVDSYPWNCPFCGIEGESLSHVAEHLERISATALPFIETEDSSLASDRAQGTSISHPKSPHSIRTIFALSCISLAIYRFRKPLGLASLLYAKERALGLGHIYTLDTVNSLGDLYNKQGSLSEAERMYLRALEGREGALGRDHKSTLDTINSLGDLYTKQGKLSEAERMYLWALEGREETLGRDHKSTLDTVNSLGDLYIKQGKLLEAERMYLRALEGREETLGRDHKSTLNTVNSLGDLYTKQGKLLEAERMYLRALEGREETLGRDHKSTLDTVNSLGDLYTKQGKLLEAEKTYIRVLEYREWPWAPAPYDGSPNIALSLSNLYRDQGRIVEAEAMERRARAGW